MAICESHSNVPHQRHHPRYLHRSKKGGATYLTDGGQHDPKTDVARRSIPRKLSYGWDSSGVSSSYIAVEGLYDEGFSDMAAWRRAIELSLGETDLEKLRLIARSRTEAASRVGRARILLGYWENSSFFAVGQALGLHHQTVQRCVERAVAEDPMAALDDRPRPGREESLN
jgi:hypothetical protein